MTSCDQTQHQPEITPIQNQDKVWAQDLLREHWGSCAVVSRGILHQADELPGFKAVNNRTPAGLITFNILDSNCEIVSLDSLIPRKGIGRKLVLKVVKEARLRGCKRVWLITTNDNIDALCFYQKIGFKLVAIHPKAIEQSRRLKPQIPATGCHGIPIRDEIKLEMTLS
jgi:GNAT superfamily N-acetyltransferase